MTPMVLLIFTRADVRLLERVQVVVQAFPDDLDLGKDLEGKPIVLSCHILARGIAKPFGLDAATGYFRPNYSHSWAITPHGHIIDVYPVGIYPGPFLVEQTASFNSPGKHLYQPDIRVWHEEVCKPHIEKAIDITADVVLELVRKISLLR